MKIFFIGIGGAGMRSLALYLSEAGHEVSGSDAYAGPEAVAFWQQRNCRVFTSHDASNIEGAELVIYSAAIPVDNPERAAAQQRGIACSRGEALARFANAHSRSIAVCGTHGKGTTAAAIAMMLKDSGAHVGDILGAVPVGRTEPCHFEPDSDYLVCEVDESDRTHTFHRPRLLMINNIEADHLNNYRDLDDIVETFEHHVRDCVSHGSTVVIHYSGIGAPDLYRRLRDVPQILWVCQKGVLSSPYISYTTANPDEDGCCALTLFEGDETTTISPWLGGQANAHNLAMAAAVGRALDIPYNIIKRSLAGYKGLNDRCQICQIGRYQLVTDYASHPTCVQNDIAWIRSRAGRVIAVYHPYRYTLMQCHWQALAKTLSTADEVLLLPFDPCGEKPIENISSPALAKAIAAHRHATAEAFDSFEACFEAAAQRIRHGDALLIFAGGPAFAMGRTTLENMVRNKHE